MTGRALAWGVVAFEVCALRWCFSAGWRDHLATVQFLLPLPLLVFLFPAVRRARLALLLALLTTLLSRVRIEEMFADYVCENPDGWPVWVLDFVGVRHPP